MESQFSSYLDGEHSAQTAKEGVIGHVQLPVGQLAEIGSISSLSMPFQMAALSRNGSIKTRQLTINSLSLSSTGPIEERLTISSRAGFRQGFPTYFLQRRRELASRHRAGPEAHQIIENTPTGESF